MAGSVSGARRLGAFGRAVLYLFLAVVGLTMLAPFFWTTTTSLRTQEDIFSDVLTVPLPSPRVLSMWIPWERRVVVDGLEVPAVALETLERVELPNGETLDLAPGRVKKTLFSQECVVLPKDEAGQPLKARFVGRFVAVRTLGEGSRRLVVPAEEVMWRPKPVWENYVTAWHRVPFGRGYFNSVLVAAVITLGQVLTSSLAAYAFARLTFPGRDKLFLGYLATLMIPAVVTMIPVFILMRTLPDALNNLTNTDVWTGQLAVSLGGRHFNLGRPVGTDSYFALIAPALFSAYGTFLLRQFFMGIPRDLEDAAWIDGCSHFGTYSRIVMPLSKPALATLTIFTFMGTWKSYMWPLIVTNAQEMQVLPVLLKTFQGSPTNPPEMNLLMAGSIIELGPMLLIFMLGQRYFVEGIRLGAIKG